MKNIFRGFGIRGFRSFGQEPQFLFPFEKINLFVGRNNVGKSNSLKLIELLGNNSKSNSNDLHKGRKTDFGWYFPVQFDDLSVKEFLIRLAREKRADYPDLESKVEKITPLTKEIIKELFPEYNNPNTETAWILHNADMEPEKTNARAIKEKIELNPHFQSLNIEILWRDLAKLILNSFSEQFGDGNVEGFGSAVLRKIASLAHPVVQPVKILGVHRQIGEPESPYSLNGMGIIKFLGDLKNPDLASRTVNLEKYKRIENFVAEVLEDKNTKLDIPNSGREFNVEMNGRMLSIQSLGTGVHQVIIFAAAATSVSDEIICIEEPEIHMHPRLQRQLLKYLYDHTDNQYFITTHSACLLDAPNTAIFHLTLNNHQETEVRKLHLPGHRAEAGFDLGYRASDLVQANSIIWVEGPSDRIYINAWIHALAPELSEGLHYSVMFYGGRLLSHLTVCDQSVVDFIALQRLNRKVAMVLDSDRSNENDELNDTKNRVRDEINNEKGFVWITAGREIENYVSTENFSKALATVHPKVSFEPANTKWHCCYKAAGKENFAADKVAIARAAVISVNLDVHDLREKANELVEFIQRANL